MKYRHTKQPQTYYTERNHAADRKTKKGPCPFVFFFFSLVYINKAEKTDTHIFIYQTHPGNSLRMATFIPDRDQHI